MDSMEERKINRHITFIDGSPEEQNQAMKEFFGLRLEQSFQDLEIDDDTED